MEDIVDTFLSYTINKSALDDLKEGNNYLSQVIAERGREGLWMCPPGF